VRTSVGSATEGAEVVRPVRTDSAATFFEGFPWTRSAIAPLVDHLLAHVPRDDPERAELVSRARKYSRDCGCAMGGAFLGVAVLLTIAYLTATLDVSVRSLVAGAVCVFAATVVGKLIGLLLAWVRLVVLYRSLSRRRRAAADHVYVH
jgi:hypothetical protein